MSNKKNNALNAWGSEPWSMAGTESTFEYVVALLTTCIRLGLRRAAHQGVYRVRVEVKPEATQLTARLASVLTPGSGWMQPGQGGQPRFSKTVSLSDEDGMVGLLVTAVNAILGVDGGADAVFNESAPDWLEQLVLVAAARQFKLPGANLAKAWPLRTLRGKVQSALAKTPA